MESCDRAAMHYSHCIDLEEKQQKDDRNIGHQCYLVFLKEEEKENNEDTA